MYVCISVVMLWKCNSIASGSLPMSSGFIVSIRARAIGPVAPASPNPLRPASVSIRMRQLPAIFWMAIALIAVIFMRLRCGAARAR